jgi:hypothetical protein
MMGIVSQGLVSYDLFEELADPAREVCPIGAPDGRGHTDGGGACLLSEMAC